MSKKGNFFENSPYLYYLHKNGLKINKFNLALPLSGLYTINIVYRYIFNQKYISFAKKVIVCQKWVIQVFDFETFN